MVRGSLAVAGGALETEAFRLLAVSDDATHWRIAAESFWGAALDRRTMDAATTARQTSY